MKRYAGIPIQNIWLLMLYASDFNLKQTRQAIAVLEKNQHELGLIEWFSQLLGEYLKNMSSRYTQKNQALSQIRGKIDLKQTYQRDSLRQGKIYCHYAELNLDHAEHQYLLFAIHHLLPETTAALYSRLRQCQLQLEQMGVSLPRQLMAPIPKIQPTVAQKQLQQLCDLAKLLMEFQIPSTDLGKILFQQVNFEDLHWLRRLFEKAVAGFYKKYLDTSWQVLHGALLKWPRSVQHTAMPSMKSDIILKQQQGRCILIDTKFTQIFNQAYYNKRDIFKSQHVYQLYSYLRSQEYPGSRFQFDQGILLYPSIGQTVQADIQLHHYKIGFYTVDLMQQHSEIEAEFLSFIV